MKTRHTALVLPPPAFSGRSPNDEYTTYRRRFVPRRAATSLRILELF